MSNPILGVCGTFASGKDTVAAILERDHNMYHVSTSDIVREKSMELYGNIERETLHKVATDYRKTKGGDYFVRESYRRYQEIEDRYSGVVISGIRSLGEGRALVELGGEMIFVDAPVEMRYERMSGRQRDGESRKTLEEFLAFEKKERGGETDDEWAFNIDKLGVAAKYKIVNDGSYDEFVAKVHALAREVGLK